MLPSPHTCLVMASNKQQKRISDFFSGNTVKKSKNSDGNSSQTKDVNNNVDETATEPSPKTDTDTNSVQTSAVSRPMSASASSEVCELDVNMDSAEVGTHDRMAAREADKPYQPRIKFPGRRFGGETFERSFQCGWFDKWKWLHYIRESDSVICFICAKATDKGLLNWKKAREKFAQHELSELHSDSVRALESLKLTPINAVISDIAARDQATGRAVLELFFRSIKLLGREGLPLRGHAHRDGVLWQLMLERTHALPKEREWMLRRDNWMSDTIQKEILGMFAHAIQREIMSQISHCSFFGLTADGTTDISASEQFSCCLQFVDSDLRAQNVFLGFYNASDSSAETLFSCIKDIFIRLNIPLERLAGYCFDGASNMSGRINGVRAKLKAECPVSLYVHCSNHALDLVLQEVAREVRLIADTLNFVQGVSVVISESAKRKQLFRSLFGSEDVVCNLLGLCPTRWCIRSTAISRVISAYATLLETLKTLERDKSVRAEIRSKIFGLCTQAKQARTYFGLVCSQALFEPSEAFFEAVDLIQTVKRRFDQSGIKVAAQRETTLIEAANQNLSGLNEEMQLPEKFDRSRIQMQLTLLGDLTKERRFTAVKELAEFISSLHPQTRELFKEVEAFIELCLCLPVSAAPSERSFSALRRLKTWTRSTTSQKRLTHLALMHIHSDILDRLDIPSLVRSFISNTPERKAMFGAL
uniref:Uncharacterized protein n=1 Tax=Cyprinus carpio TaxID=7962 RepID=A0A8C1YNY7_CYPCA